MPENCATPTWKTVWLSWLSSLFGLVLFVLALFVLHDKLSMLRYPYLIYAIHHIPMQRIVVAFLFTFLDYFILTAYDSLAFRFIAHSLNYSRIALTSFLCYAFGHNIGCSFLSGGSIRYKLYSSYGVPLKKIANLIGFTSLTYWLGFLAVGSVVFLFRTIEVRNLPHLHVDTARPIGAVFLIALIGFLIWNTNQKKPMRILGWDIPHLTMDLCVAQIAVGSLELILAASVLYSLLPIGIPFSVFIGIFLLAQISAVVSQVPGGIGVFETVILFLLPSRPGSSEMLVGTLLVYRGIYYIIPLIIATVIFAIHEYSHRVAKWKKSAE